ncbi:MAG TPA: energy-coupling factor transporter transmembrane component T [Clostridia bacterium]
MRDIALGQYYPAKSIIHEMDPRSKILISLIYMVSIFFINTYTVYIITFLILFITVLLSKVPIRLILKSVKPIIFLIIFTAIINLFLTPLENKPYSVNLYFKQWTVNNIIFQVKWGSFRFGLTWTGVNNALKMALRLILLVMGPSLLTLTTTPVNLTDGVESLMSPLKIIKFPVHELALIMSITLKFIPNIIEETDKIMMAQRARCADFDSGNLFKKAKALLPVIIPLFVSSLRRAEELAYAMDSRCYRGSKGRTKMKELKFKFADYAALVLAAGFMFFILMARYNWFSLGWINALV